MDQKTTTLTTPIAQAALEHPAHLIVGSHDATREYAHQFLMNIWCASACTVCRTCMAIRQEQYHNLLWLRPSNNYTKEDLAPLFNTISFALDPQEQFFIVLESADLLTQSSANSLLKSIEEPPTGYHFLLLAQRLETIPLTIRSRCLVTVLSTRTDAFSTHPLYLLCTATSKQSAAELIRILEQPITEQETAELVDALILFWSARYTASLQTGTSAQQALLQQKIELLTAQLTQLPMPGSSKLFWKNLFLQLN